MCRGRISTRRTWNVLAGTDTTCLMPTWTLSRLVLCGGLSLGCITLPVVAFCRVIGSLENSLGEEGGEIGPSLIGA